jgi:hypothetical protein
MADELHYWAVKKAPKVKKEIKMSDTKWYKLDALSSITAYELAQIFQSMDITVQEDVLLKMPRDVRRHFQVTTDPTKSSDPRP